MAAEGVVQSKPCSKCNQVKPLDAFTVDRQAKLGVGSSCRQCQKEWREANKESISRRTQLSRKKNKESVSARNAAWQSKNPEKVAEKKRRFYERHQDRLRAESRQKRLRNLEAERERGRRWAKENPEKAAAINARRRARLLRATPQWANDFIISEIYAFARDKSKALGIKFNVDHIVPLKGKLVCGLHVESNLAVIPAAENFSKQSRYWPDMP